MTSQGKVEPEEIVRYQSIVGEGARFHQFVMSMGWLVDAKLHQGWAGGSAVLQDPAGFIVYYSDINMEVCTSS